jgi:hypothetical protein
MVRTLNPSIEGSNPSGPTIHATAVLAYGVRYHLDEGVRRLAERRLAHVYVHDVTDICAAGTHVIRLAKLSFPLKEGAFSDRDFEASHAGRARRRYTFCAGHSTL